MRLLLIALSLLLVATACNSASESTDTTPPTKASGDTAPPPTVPDGAFFLNLQTGEQTLLPSARVEDSQVRFDEGHYYAVSPNGSKAYWENT